MLIYTVFLTKDDDFDSEELEITTYSNEEAAKEHVAYLENSGILKQDKWDYAFIRQSRVYDKFELERRNAPPRRT